MQIKNLLIPIALIVGCLAATYRQTLEALGWGHDSWQITEWLINYQGGFVRRGLPGELILKASNLIEIDANVIAVFISLIIYCLIFLLLYSKVKSFFSIAFLASPVVLGSAAYQNFIVRKDGLVILCFILCLLISNKISGAISRTIIINIIACLAIASHESFFFFGMPALILINTSANFSNYINYIKKLGLTFLYFSPAFITFAVSVKAHGTKLTADLINQSLLNLWFKIEPNNPCDCFSRPGGSIDALQWSTSQGLALSRSLIHAYSHGIWVPLAWLITIIICFVLTLNFYRDSVPTNAPYENQGNRKPALMTALIFQLVIISPLFVLGWDFGRWIFIWITSSIALFAFNKESLPAPLELFSSKISGIFRSFKLNYKLNYWPLIFIGIPECCWSLYKFMLSMPAGYFINWINPNALLFLK